MQIIGTYSETHWDRTRSRRTTTKVQKMHITELQIRFVAERIGEWLDGENEDIDETCGGIEVIGCGLNASVEFYAMAYDKADEDDDDDETGYILTHVRLITYDSEGNEIPNDCQKMQLIRAVNDYLRER